MCDLEKCMCNFVPDIRPFKVVRLSIYVSVSRFSGIWLCTHSKKSICYHFLFNACFPPSLDRSALFLPPPPSTKAPQDVLPRFSVCLSCRSHSAPGGHGDVPYIPFILKRRLFPPESHGTVSLRAEETPVRILGRLRGKVCFKPKLESS